jgi:hypothetical protein
MADPVEEQLNFMIDDIDASIAGKYPFRLRDILEHPLDYKDRATIVVEIEKMKGDVIAYFDARKEEVGEGVKAYMREAGKASRLAERVGDAVKDAAKAAKKAYISPLAYARKDGDDEIIFIDEFDEEALPKVIEAFTKDCMFVTDVSLELDGMKVGRWLFPNASGAKNRGLFVSFPVNPAGALDIARDQMVLALEAVKTEVLSQLSLEGKPLPFAPKAAAAPPQKPEAPKPAPKK